MAAQSLPKMSLASQFDDLRRYSKVLTVGSEMEFKKFCENQYQCFLKLKESESIVKNLKERINSLESENKRLQTHVKHVKDIVEQAVNRRNNMELEKNALERQITIIKEVLLADGVMDNQTKEKLGFLSACKTSMHSPPHLETIAETASALSISDFTRTDDALDPTCSRIAGQSKEKRCSSETKVAIKRVKLDSLDDDPFTDIYENSFAYKPVSTRSSSEPSAFSPEKAVSAHAVSKSDSSQFKNPTYESRRSTITGTPVHRYSTGGKLSRGHSFITKILCRPEKCHACHSGIGFIKQALKCEDCRVICHPDCKDQCPLPCVPVIHTPTKGKIGSIADFTSAAPPMIPLIIVHCINEIESRGLKDVGLYRISGSDREIKVLKEKFLSGHSVPSLHQSDVHAICGTIKEFLRSLSEPLIPYSTKTELINAADLQDMDKSLSAMYEIISNLPEPNRDTLAFLVLHLQRVAESPDSKMPISSLAKMLGPSVVGFSPPESGDINIIEDTQNQSKIMEKLLVISSDLWNGLLNVDPDEFASGQLKTPEATPAPKETRLGPIYATKSKSFVSKKRPPVVRASRYNRSGKMSSSSPLLNK